MAHIIVLDSNEDIFVCGPCKTVFNSMDMFLEHKKMKCGEQVQQDISKNDCDHGAIASAMPSGADEVVKEETVPDIQIQVPQVVRYSCEVCGKTMKTRKGLSAHNKSHFIKSYQCLVCGRCFIQKSHLQRHVPSHKVWPESLCDTIAKSSDTELLAYSCPYCKDIFSNYNQFRAHLKNHQNLKVFKCIQGDCLCLFESLENLLKHVQSAHIESVYSCYICKETFKSLKSIYSHQQSHHEIVKNVTPKQFKCSKCDAVYNTPEKLSLHMQTENHTKKCIHCNRVFASNKRLRLHLQVHREGKPFKCHICNSSFHMKKYLTTHMLRHDERNFMCGTCKSMFKRQDLLQRHMRMHQVNKMFQCPYRDVLNCKKEFNRKDKLNLHIKTHSGWGNRHSSNNVNQNNDTLSNIGDG